MIGNSKISNPGGGLVTIADVMVEDGAVTEFGAPDVGFVDGGVYEFKSNCIQNGAGTSSFGWLFDSDEIAANYKRTDLKFSRQSTDTTANYNQFDDTRQVNTAGMAFAAGGAVYSELKIQVYGTVLVCSYWCRRDGAKTTVARYTTGSMTYDSGTLPAQVGVKSSLASGIANGSTIKGVRLY